MKKNISDKLRNALLKLNLTEKEIVCYYSLLENESASVQEISRSTGTNRVSIYAAIDELKAKQLITETKKGKRTLFAAESPESLKGLINKKKEIIAEEERILDNLILPSLKAINVNQKNKPEFKFYEGLDGIYKVYDDYILNSNDVLDCGSYDAVMKVSDWETEKKYIEEIRKRKIFFRNILEDTPTNRKYAEAGRGVLHTKFLPLNQKTSSDIFVFSSTVALISYDKLTATLIEDKSIAASLKMYLEFMWERL